MRSRNREGSALVLALIAFIVLAATGAAFFSIALARQRTTARASTSESVLHIAEAGLDDAVNKMTAYANTANPPTGADFAVIGTSTTSAKYGTVTQVSGAVNNGSYTVFIIPAYAGKATYRLVSVGSKDTEKRAIESWVAPDNLSPFPDFGLFGDVSVDAGGTMMSDSYKSTLGYLPTVKVHGGTTYTYDLANGSVGSNGSVTTNGNSKIFGNATPGPGSTYSGGGFVLGSTTPASSAVSIQPVSYNPPAGSTPGSLPAAVTMAGYTNKVITLGSAGSTTPTVYHVDSIVFGQARTIRVVGPVVIYSEGQIKLNAKDEFLLEGDPASVQIYQNTGDLHINGQALVGMSSSLKKVPNKFKVDTATTGDIQFNGGSEVYAMVNAPAASFTQNGNSDFFGALIGKTVKVTGTGRFHYDEDSRITSNSAFEYKIKSWKEFVP